MKAVRRVVLAAASLKYAASLQDTGIHTQANALQMMKRPDFMDEFRSLISPEKMTAMADAATSIIASMSRDAPSPSTVQSKLKVTAATAGAQKLLSVVESQRFQDFMNTWLQADPAGNGWESIGGLDSLAVSFAFDVPLMMNHVVRGGTGTSIEFHVCWTDSCYLQTNVCIAPTLGLGFSPVNFLPKQTEDEQTEDEQTEDVLTEEEREAEAAVSAAEARLNAGNWDIPMLAKATAVVGSLGLTNFAGGSGPAFGLGIGLKNGLGVHVQFPAEWAPPSVEAVWVEYTHTYQNLRFHPMVADGSFSWCTDVFKLDFSSDAEAAVDTNRPRPAGER